MRRIYRINYLFKFYDHFKNLLSKGDIFYNDNMSQLHVNDYLDRDFDTHEILKATSSLKNGKSGGADLLIPEICTNSKQWLAPVFCKLFNYIYMTGQHPESWTVGLIVLVPKKGDLHDVNNYWGITPL